MEFYVFGEIKNGRERVRLMVIRRRGRRGRKTREGERKKEEEDSDGS